MPGNYFKSGSWNICCDVCNRKVKATDIFKRWDGLLVCKDDFEQDHPQKYIRVRADGMAVPEIRERGGEIDVGPTCDYWSRSALADFGTADCSVANGNGATAERLIELYRPATSSIAAIAIAGFSVAGVI